MTSDDLDQLVTMRQLVRTGDARQLRQGAGLSRRELAASVGVTVSTLTKWELGQRVPNGDAALRYARVLGRLQATAAGAPA